VRGRASKKAGTTGEVEQTRTPSGLRRNAPLLRSSVSLSSATGLAAFGGFVYWLLIARVAPAGIVGTAAALYSSIQFVNYVTALGLPIAVARYGTSPREVPSVLFNWSVVLTVASSFLGAALYFAIVPRELHALTAVGVAGAFLIFGVIVAGISIFTLLDVRLISQQRRSWVVGKATFVALVRLPFVFVPGIAHSAVDIFLVAAGAPALCGVVAWVLADLRRVRFAFPLRPLPADTRSAVTYAAVNGAAQLAVQAPFYALPVIVLLVVSARANASFYVAWTVTTVVFLVVQGVGQALLIEGHRTGRLSSQTRSALRLGLVLATGLFVVCVIGSRVVPLLYGSAYTSGAQIMPILGAAVLPWSIFTVVLAATRVRHDQRNNLVLSGFFAASVLVPAAFLVVHFGIRGAAWAWLTGNVVSAIAAWVVVRRLRSAAEEPALAGDSPGVELLDNPEFL
jgi:O-antigen/teichoic acid export membrane protein